MRHTHRMYSLLILFSLGCSVESTTGSSGGSFSDCRNDGRGCNAGFTCQADSFGDYECLPVTNSTPSGGGSPTTDGGSTTTGGGTSTDGGGSTTSGGGTSSGGGDSGNGAGSYECCLNGSYFVCPNSAANDRCFSNSDPSECRSEVDTAQFCSRGACRVTGDSCESSNECCGSDVCVESECYAQCSSPDDCFTDCCVAVYDGNDNLLGGVCDDDPQYCN